MVVTRRNGNPGLPASNHFKVFYNGARRIGYKQVNTGYMAINTRAADDRGMCIQQGFCVQGCKTAAKWSTLYTEIPRAEATGNLDLRAECRAVRIEHGADGRVTGVIYRDPAGSEQRQRARVVCVACNAVETARLLLLSESSKYPNGLANSSDQVGRHFCHHTGCFVWGVFDKPIDFWRGTTLRRHRSRRDSSRPQARVRRRLPSGDGRARPAEHRAGRISADTLGTRTRLRDGPLPLPGWHLCQRRRSTALDQSDNTQPRREGSVRIAGRQHPR